MNAKQEVKGDEVSQIVKCIKCGFENPANLKFCGNCGARLSIAIEAPKPFVHEPP